MNHYRISSRSVVSGAVLVALLGGLFSPLAARPAYALAEDLPPSLDLGAQDPFGATQPDLTQRAQALEDPYGATQPGIVGGPNPFGCLGGLAGAAGTVGGWFTGGFAVSDLGNLGATVFNCIQTALGAISGSITAGGISYLVAKSKADVLATGLLKAAIRTTRDMVKRWIITGRFEGPVFSGSFSIDAQRSAENAARILLGEVTRINFCAPFPSPPPQAFFAADISISLACTFPGDYGLFQNGQTFDFVQLWTSEETANDWWNAQVAILDAKLKAEARAVAGFQEEYRAGQGFLCIKDPDTGKCTTPGSYVAKLVMESDIVSPIRQTDVANDIQTAIADILDTAIRVSIERGLDGTFKGVPGRIEGRGGTAR